MRVMMLMMIISRHHNCACCRSEEPVGHTAMDIGTGHMILAYMEEHLANKDKLTEDWAAIVQYLPDRIDTRDARAVPSKNRDMDVVPCKSCAALNSVRFTSDDHNRVRLIGGASGDYVNASPVYDVNPSHPEYIVAQSPSPGLRLARAN